MPLRAVRISGCCGNQRDWREIARAVIERSLMQKLRLRVRQFTAEQELITVGIGLGDARAAGHAAGAGNVLDNDRLAENIGQAPPHRRGLAYRKRRPARTAPPSLPDAVGQSCATRRRTDNDSYNRRRGP